MIEQAKAVAQRLRSPLFPSEDNLKVAATIDALVQENLRLAGEVASRNRRALEGDEATKALDKAHDYYEAKLSALRAEAEQYLSDWKACTAMNRELLAEVQRYRDEMKAMECDDVGELRKEVERLKQEQAEPVVIDRGCFERGCACFDSRIDNDGVKVYEQRK